MTKFLLSRLWQSTVLMALISVIAFAILHLAPGGPLAQFAMSPDIGAEELQRLSHDMGLDRPLPIQYTEWLTNLLGGNWGISYRDTSPVLSVIWSRLGATLELGAAAMLLAVLLGTWSGVLSATRSYSKLDYVVTLTTMLALSLPIFWFGLVMIYIFSVKLGWLPAGGIYTVGDGSFGDYAIHLIAPSVVLALAITASWSRYMRSAMLDVLNQDYIRTARAKGVGERRVLIHHALRNALLPMITVAGVQLPMLLSGAVVTETVFSWPGMGRLFVDSLNYRDYPVVMGILIVSAIAVLVCNFLADLTQALCDPRVRLF